MANPLAEIEKDALEQLKLGQQMIRVASRTLERVGKLRGQVGREKMTGRNMEIWLARQRGSKVSQLAVIYEVNKSTISRAVKKIDRMMEK